MSHLMISKKQKELFESLTREGTLIYASGPSGISTNLVGTFAIRKYKSGKEDRLDVEDGTHHVHIDWSKVKNCQIGDFHGEGMITFFDNETTLFKLYKPSGLFSDQVTSKIGNLI